MEKASEINCASSDDVLSLYFYFTIQISKGHKSCLCAVRGCSDISHKPLFLGGRGVALSLISHEQTMNETRSAVLLIVHRFTIIGKHNI